MFVCCFACCLPSIICLSAYCYIVCACLLLLSHLCLLSVLLHEHCIAAYDMLHFKSLHFFICVSVQHSHFGGNGRVSRLSRGSGGIICYHCYCFITNPRVTPAGSPATVTRVLLLLYYLQVICLFCAVIVVWLPCVTLLMLMSVIQEND